MPKRTTKKRVSTEGLHASDSFSNLAARMGVGTPSLAEGSEYPLIRISNDYQLMLSLYRNHWIARRVVETPAQDMVKAWPKITSEMKPEDVSLFDRRLARSGTKQSVLQAMKWARLFGGAGALMVIAGHEDMLDEPLDIESVDPGSYKGLIPFDRWSGISPSTNVSTDYGNPQQFGLPEMYHIQASAYGAKRFNVHASRVLRFIGPDVPTPELQAQLGWGISVIEVIYEELKKRDNMSWSILQLLFRAQILTQKNDEMAQMLSGANMPQASQQRLYRALQAQNHLMSNQSMLFVPKDGGIESHQYTFGGVADVYQQFQLDIAGAAQIPVTRLFGRTLSGLGQSNDADIQVYEDTISQKQHEELRPQLEKLYPVILMSEFGEVPDDLDFDFPSVRTLSEKEKYELAKTGTEAILSGFTAGVYSQQLALQELQKLGEKTDMFTSITPEVIDAADDDVKVMGDLDQAEHDDELAQSAHEQEKELASQSAQKGSPRPAA